MPPPPPSPAPTGRRRWLHRLSPTVARDRCYTRAFRSAGLRPAAVPLADGAFLHIWLPPPASGPRRRSSSSMASVPAPPGSGPPSSARCSLPASRPTSRTSSSSAHPPPQPPTAPRPTRRPASPSLCQRFLARLSGTRSSGLATAVRRLPPRPRVPGGGGPARPRRRRCVPRGADLAAGLFAVDDIAVAASLLLPQRPEDLRKLVGLTFCRPPRFMPSCFIRDYIRVMCTEHVKEKTELLYALINGRKLPGLPKIRQIVFVWRQTLIIWGEQDRVFPLELGLRLKRHLGDTSELVIVKNAGHAINREKPAELCRLIINYVVDPSVKYRDDRKGYWRNVVKRFAGSSLRKMDSSRPLL